MKKYLKYVRTILTIIIISTIYSYNVYKKTGGRKAGWNVSSVYSK